LGVLQKGIRIGDVTFPNLGAVLNAFKSDSDINVIATPQILTTDNKKATIKVGENVPFQTSQSANSAVVGQVFNNFEYKDVATSLTITPQVNQSDVIRMEIGVEVIKVKGTSASITPTTLTRTANTTVVVHNEETVVIGGMIGQDTNAVDSKVPLLGDIPLLGWLFKSHSNTDQKTNLYIFITPHIVESPAELAEINLKKRDEMEALHREPGGVADQFFHPPVNPAHSAALTDIGFAKLEKNDLARAREYFNQALKIDPENGAALVNLGMVCEREGKKSEAEALYRKVLARASAKEEKKGAQGQVVKDPWNEIARENIKRLKQSNASGK
jgi:general secretion pathway protein D